MNAGRRLGTQVAAWRVLTVAASVCVIMLAGGCSRPAGAPAPSPAIETASASVTPSVPTTPSASVAVAYPNLASFSDPFSRFAYKHAYSTCQFGAQAGAEAFGGDPNDPSSVARAYAEATFPISLQYREATFRGCLDALEMSAT